MTQWAVALVAASLVGGQMPGGAVPGAPASGAGTLVVPAGTTLALTLMTPIQSQATKVGTTVRAVVAFPVTIGAQVAIPAGTYVEGLVNAVDQHGPSVKIHFTRMLFANGYSVPLDALNTHAQVEWPGVGGDAGPQRVGELAWGAAPPAGWAQNAETSPTNPTLPPLPQVGPSKGAIIGASLGGVAAVVLVTVLTTRHRGSGNHVLFDNGWQFQMVLDTPLTLDAARVAAAGSAPAPQ